MTKITNQKETTLHYITNPNFILPIDRNLWLISESFVVPSKRSVADILPENQVQTRPVIRGTSVSLHK